VPAGEGGEGPAEVPPEPYALQARHCTEIRVLNREVRIIFRGVDKFGNLIGSVIYPVGDQPTDLALELVKLGLAKVRIPAFPKLFILYFSFSSPCSLGWTEASKDFRLHLLGYANNARSNSNSP
jgi:endonuclease YncB( thermonuclease family)